MGERKDARRTGSGDPLLSKTNQPLFFIYLSKYVAHNSVYPLVSFPCHAIQPAVYDSSGAGNQELLP